MGMSTHVTAFVPPDAKWQTMKAAYDACKAAKVAVPADVAQFFGYCDPDPAGVTVNQSQLEACGALKDYDDESSDGYEIEIAKLPPHVTKIRFWNSY